MGKIERNTSIEVLRMVFMLLIVVLHGYGHGMEGKLEEIYAWGNVPGMRIHLMLFTLGKLGVTGFMFISGYYGIRFNIQRLTEMIFMLLFYAVLTNDGTGREQLLHPWDIWWFVSCYLFVFILSPIISNGIEHINKKTFSILIGGLLIYIYFGHFLSSRNEHSLDLLLTIYLSGRYTKLYLAEYMQKKTIKLALVLSFALICYATPPYIFSSERLMSIWISNNNILLLIICASITVLIENKKTYCKVINYFSTSVLAVYLLTDNKKSMQWDVWLLPRLIDGIGFIIVLGVFAGCLIIDKIRTCLFKIIINIFYRFYNK